MGTENPNPYASPQAVDEVVPTAFSDGEGYYRDGKLLVVKNGAELPDRCVYCNEHSGAYRKTSRTYWFSIISGVTRRVRVSYGVCSKHRFRKRVVWTAVIPLYLAFVLAPMILHEAAVEVVFHAYGGDIENVMPLITKLTIAWGLAVLVGQSLLLWAIHYWACGPILVRKANQSRAWLQGARKPFLASLGEAEE